MTMLPALSRSAAVRIFLAFAFCYFFSALLRAVTATLAPEFGRELGLRNSDLGLLAGIYFLGFASMQLPLGAALDRHGPKRVLLALLSIAVIGCVAFSMADSLRKLILARALIGVGVSACLMAPLTCFRARFSLPAQLRANSWMLMTGSFGMVASTLPVQWLLPVWGWRGLFWAVAALLLLAMVVVTWIVPADEEVHSAGPVSKDGYLSIIRHPTFVRSAPMGFFIYGGMIAMQALWAGPWLTRVAHWSATEAAGGLFAINLSMLMTFLAWGVAMPRLVARGLSVRTMLVRGLPISMVWLAVIAAWPDPLGAWAWALWCVCCTFVSLSQPAVAQAFSAAQAGRALSAYNLVIFAGVFALQWGIGMLIDLYMAAGLEEAQAFRSALGTFGLGCVLSYLWYGWPSWRGRDRQAGQ